MIAIADTSFVIGLANGADPKHKACEQVKRRMNMIIMPQSVLAEVGYMFTRELGSRALANFLRRLDETKYRIEALSSQDIYRTAELLDQYADTRVDFVDASIAAVAERMGITHILTLDQRDFQIIHPKHISHFELLPTPS
jgi:predicted nucleic acid-binding protein